MLERINFVILCFRKMKKIYYIAILILAGFFLTPVESYACSTKSENTETFSRIQLDSTIEKKDCCGKETTQCGKQGKDCEENCDNSDCHCPTSSSNFTIPFFAQLLQTKVILSKKLKFYFQEAYYSSGFLSIWLPPKIG